ncbi:hypothetical protein K438DRAFT_1748583 [Mycena galopus ATCC 62051]|nr:hypothetical protein K438DRAFT_1748583 [Mycena galopus ATCC 62051]
MPVLVPFSARNRAHFSPRCARRPLKAHSGSVGKEKKYQCTKWYREEKQDNDALRGHLAAEESTEKIRVLVVWVGTDVPVDKLNIVLVARATFEGDLERKKEQGQERTYDWLRSHDGEGVNTQNCTTSYEQQGGHLLPSGQMRRMNDGGLKVAFRPV